MAVYDDPDMMTVEEAAGFLRITKSEVTRLVKEKKLQTVCKSRKGANFFCIDHLNQYCVEVAQNDPDYLKKMSKHFDNAVNAHANVRSIGF